MPVIRSAKKKLRQDRKKETRNSALRKLLSQTVKKANKSISEKSLQSAFRVIDKSIKNNIIHKNKGAHLKSKLSKLLFSKTKPRKSPQTAKKQPSKKSSKPTQ